MTEKLEDLLATKESELFSLSLLCKRKSCNSPMSQATLLQNGTKTQLGNTIIKYSDVSLNLPAHRFG